MNLITALINAPLTAIDTRTSVLHAATDDSVMRGWPLPKHPKPRTTVDAVCGVLRIKLVPDPADPQRRTPVAWPPTAKCPPPLTRCKACFDASTPKRPRSAFKENAT